MSMAAQMWRRTIRADNPRTPSATTRRGGTGDCAGKGQSCGVVFWGMVALTFVILLAPGAVSLQLGSGPAVAGHPAIAAEIVGNLRRIEPATIFAATSQSCQWPEQPDDSVAPYEQILPSILLDARYSAQQGSRVSPGICSFRLFSGARGQNYPLAVDNLLFIPIFRI